MKPFRITPLTYFHMSRPAPCPYLPGQVEQMVFTDLSAAGDPASLHYSLSRAGFRRSQSIAYRPNCRGCVACVPVRVSAIEFEPNRTQRRVTKRNADVTSAELAPAASLVHYRLFQRYIGARHGAGGMTGMTMDDYMTMVQDSPVPTRLFDFRGGAGELLGVCLTDVLDDGLSLVYSFFDPTQSARGLGTYIILWHIAEARRRGLPYVYLGYWIQQSLKMAYKDKFRPAERLAGAGWQPLVD
ncbi:MAG: arginyltransferase [Alphaproteobacteria bacterium]|nr:arginyltransferase [Alphaproteobacteria bacterium]